MTKARDLASIPAGSGDFSVDSNTLFVDASTDSVGIGTSTDSGKLNVYKAGGETQLKLRADSTQSSAIYFTEATSGYRGFIAYDNVNEAMRFGTNSGGERVRIDSSGHLIVPNGVTLGTAVGTYSAANTLDDYEEGTWTPVYNPQNGSFGTVTYDIQNGLYTKVGNIVYIELNLRTDGIVLNTASGVVRISGLPFTPSSSNPGGSLSIGYSDLFAGEEPTSALTSTSSGMIVLYYRTSSSTGTIGLNVADLATGANDNFIFLSGVYRTDS